MKSYAEVDDHAAWDFALKKFIRWEDYREGVISGRVSASIFDHLFLHDCHRCEKMKAWMRGGSASACILDEEENPNSWFYYRRLSFTTSRSAEAIALVTV